MSRECQILRVFTRDGLGGNHLGVVTDPSGLTSEMMQAIAVENGFSETIFCDLSGEIPIARIFTPGAELPFAGHPLVGLGWLLNDTVPDGVDRIRYEAGEAQVSSEAGLTWIQVSGDQPVEPIDPPLLGGEVAVSVSMPIPYSVIRLSSPRQVADMVTPPISFGEVYVWAWEDPGQVVKARFFAGEVGVAEDPATGSAAVALAAHLRRSGQVEGRLIIHQGDEIGHPSTIRLRWDQAFSSIGGTVVRDEVRRLEL
ncbi:MAG TPA: PhzF family phenazine biosynthesis protein [Acidimicrobiia bacterium]|nr:PhzF family phenazine biosynthesis protein [Acidimicrobiia bacterium]